MEPVIERPSIFSTGLPTGFTHSLTSTFQQYGYRINRLLPKDGTEAMSGKLTLIATTASAASINLPHGTAPSSPVDGDMWTTTAGLFVRINGSTVGPLT